MSHVHFAVFHSGALGDLVMVWPLLRAMTSQNRRILLAARASHAELTRRFLGASIDTIDIEHRTLNALWRGEHASDWPVHADEVLSFLASPDEPAGRVWHVAARRMFKSGTSRFVPPPINLARHAIWQQFQVDLLGRVAQRHNPEGPIVLHVGAGERSKVWPMDRWEALAGLLSARATPPRLLAGEVEHERFSAAEHRTFQRLGGVFVPNLIHLAAELSHARLSIGADTGPSHLAAQLGVPTLALFGPTDPRIWSPVGPMVRVLAPTPGPAPMDWLSANDVAAAALAMLRNPISP